MPINVLPPPDAANQAFLAGLGENPDEKHGRFSFPIYALTAAELVKPGGYPVARAVGWYFVADTATGIVAGEVPDANGAATAGQGPLTTSLSFGSLVDDTWKAFGQLQQNPPLLVEPFQVLWLRLAGLAIEAFWLKASPFDGRIAANDWFYAVFSFQPMLKRLLLADGFLRLVRQLAAESLLVDNAPNL